MARAAKRRLRAVADSARRSPVAVGVVLLALAVAALLVVRMIGSGSNVVVIDSDSTGDDSIEASGIAGAVDGEEESTIFVHVTGSVATPGLYELPEGARVAEAVQAAGGFAENAATEALNLARVLFDGEQVSVPSLESLAPPQPGSSGGSPQATNGLVNINTADVTELDAITGVGPSTAEKIVADREENGPFATIEDLKRVSGIGDKKFEAMRDEICVG